jgi:hypothetical protein
MKMEQAIEFSETGFVDSITGGVTSRGNFTSYTKSDYVTFNGEKYGPVVYDDSVGLGFSTGVKMHLNMAKVDSVWRVCAIKHVESEKIFTMVPSTVGPNLGIAIMQHFFPFLILWAIVGGLASWLGYAIGIGGQRNLTSPMIFGFVIGFIPAFFYARAILSPILQMKVTRKLSAAFGSDKIH